ncbi:hypothetical protein ASD39_25270 [Sphingomonas sp. Root50]|nr:hypothetical protein ASD39_25270 [Sphingomonas sp. Root50]
MIGFADMRGTRLIQQRSHRLQPLADRVGCFGREHGLDPSAAVVAHYDDVLDLQILDGKQKSCREVGIMRQGEVRDIAMNEHFSGIEVDDFGRWHSAVGAADPEIARPLLAHEALEECGIP